MNKIDNIKEGKCIILMNMNFTIFFKVVIASTKIKRQAKIDNFSFKNRNIIIERLI